MSFFLVVVLFCTAALIFPLGFYIDEVGGQPYKLPNNTVVGSSYVLFVLSIFFTIVGLLFAGKVCLPGWHVCIPSCLCTFAYSGRRSQCRTGGPACFLFFFLTTTSSREGAGGAYGGRQGEPPAPRRAPLCEHSEVRYLAQAHLSSAPSTTRTPSMFRPHRRLKQELFASHVKIAQMLRRGD